MGRIKEYYHEEIMYQYYKDLYKDSEMPIWVMEQYGFPMNTPPVDNYTVEEEEHLTEQDMKDAIDAIDVDQEMFREEYASLASGEKMLINVSFDDQGNAYPEYIIKP